MSHSGQQHTGDSVSAFSLPDYVRSVLNAPYDGILGQIPGGIPPAIAEAFYHGQFQLLCEGRYTPAVIRGWMKQRAAISDSDLGDLLTAPWPPEYEHAIRTLVLVEAMVSPHFDMKRFLGDEQFERVGAQFRQKQLAPHNEANAIPREQRELVLSTVAEKQKHNPKKSGAYAEAANELGITARRVRYIVEGRRKST
jgi:hypothetical protein